MEILKNISMVLGIILSFITLITLLIKGPRDKFLKWMCKNKRETIKATETAILEKLDTKFEHINSKLELIANDNAKQVDIFEQKLEQTNILINKSIESQQQQLRTNITNLYDRATKRGYLTFYEKKNLLMEYNTYSNTLNGNSFVETLFNEMLKLRVKDEEE